MNANSSRYPLLIALLLSLLLHLGSLIFSAPILEVQPKKEPLYVEMVPQRETAIPQQPETKPNDAKRQGVIDQQTIKEQAPKGDASEDSSTTIAQPKTVQEPAKPVRKKEEKKSEQQQPPQTIKNELAETTVKKTDQKQVEQKTTELPNLEQLLQSSNTAAADIARNAQTKERPDVENGDALILNMRQDKLFSFFSRFKRGIYRVWNYPQESIDKRQQGAAVLKIVINRDGSIEDVDLVQASGFERLDREAIASIFKGQPYGALPKDYPKEQLVITARFEYILGQRRPNIYRQ